MVQVSIVFSENSNRRATTRKNHIYKDASNVFPKDASNYLYAEFVLYHSIANGVFSLDSKSLQMIHLRIEFPFRSQIFTNKVFGE